MPSPAIRERARATFRSPSSSGRFSSSPGPRWQRIYLYAHMVIVIAFIAAAVEGVVLIIYHFILKREDPEAL